MTRLGGHLFIFATVILTVYSQLVIRWQASGAGPLPEGAGDRLGYVGALLLNPWILSAIVATFLAGVSWMLAMTRFEISYAYPFVGLTYVLVLAGGVLLFQESMSLAKLAGSALVILGIVVVARG